MEKLPVVLTTGPLVTNWLDVPLKTADPLWAPDQEMLPPVPGWPRPELSAAVLPVPSLSSHLPVKPAGVLLLASVCCTFQFSAGNAPEVPATGQELTAPPPWVRVTSLVGILVQVSVSARRHWKVTPVVPLGPLPTSWVFPEVMVPGI